MKKLNKQLIQVFLIVLLFLAPMVAYADPPVATNDTASTDEDTAVDIDVLNNDTDADDDPLTVSAVTQGSDGSVTIINNGDDVRYTPDPDFNGTDNFTYTVSDGSETDTATVEVTIDPVNDAPEANDDTASTDEDTAVIVDVLDNDTDVDGDSLTVSNVTQGSDGSVTIINNGDDVRYTPDPDFNGTDSFTYAVSDGSATDTATLTVTVGATNDGPVANDDTASTDEDTAVVVDVLANDTDAEGDSLTVSNVTQGSDGSVTIINNGDDVRYTPDPDFNGTDNFFYTVSDGSETDTATVTVTVGADNDPPVANNDTASTDEDTAVNVDVLYNDTDVDDDPLTVSAVTQGSDGSVTIINNGDDVRYTPDPDFNGTDNFTYTVSDGSETDTATVEVTVSAGNDPPVANNDTASTNEDTAVNIDVLANDTDADGDPLRVSSKTNGSYGVVSIINNGDDVRYTPNTDFNGPDNFTYTASDGNGGTNTAEVTVTVGAVNDTPVANDDTASTAEDISVVVDVLANDVDVDGDDLKVSAVTGSSDGSVTIINNGDDARYTPDTGFNGTDTFTYTASDGNGGTDTARVTVQVTGNFFVQTEDVTEIDETSATGNGDILKLGEPKPTRVGICWSDEQEPTISDSTNDIDPPFETGLFSVPISNLVPGTIYYVRAFARDRNRTPVYGSQREFTSHIEPVVTTFAVNLISDTQATANGSITDLGEPSPDDHGFCWSTDPNPTVDESALDLWGPIQMMCLMYLSIE